MTGTHFVCPNRLCAFMREGDHESLKCPSRAEETAAGEDETSTRDDARGRTEESAIIRRRCRSVEEARLWFRL